MNVVRKELVGILNYRNHRRPLPLGKDHQCVAGADDEEAAGVEGGSR
jgi:hypothetical protein